MGLELLVTGLLEYILPRVLGAILSWLLVVVWSSPQEFKLGRLEAKLLIIKEFTSILKLCLVSERL